MQEHRWKSLQQRMQHFHIYDAGGVDDDMMKIMQPYIDARKMDITDVRNVANYDVLSHGQMGIGKFWSTLRR
eukprot:jgi/Mesen1/7587/ME000393S06680